MKNKDVADALDFIITPSWVEKNISWRRFKEWIMREVGCGDTLSYLLPSFRNPRYLLWILARQEKLERRRYLEIACRCVRATIPLIEDELPVRQRPLRALRAAEKCLKNPTAKNGDLALKASDKSSDAFEDTIHPFCKACALVADAAEVFCTDAAPETLASVASAAIDVCGDIMGKRQVCKIIRDFLLDP